MPIDPQAQQLLDAVKGLPQLETLTVAEARSRFLETHRTKGDPEPVKRVLNRLIPGPETEIPIRIYIAENEGKLPILVYFHGGGGVVNNIETHDAICRSLTNGTKCVVISVNYRLAPENKYPAALEDCYAATKWTAENAEIFGGDPKRIAVGGDSSGGGLAAGVALMARDRKGPDLIFQLLIYPVADYYKLGKPSYESNGTGYSLTKKAMVWFYDHYLPQDFDPDDPYLFPLRAENLSGLPAALVITGEYDPLRDEGEMYAHRLTEAGISVGLHRYDGMMHGFVIASKFLDKGKLALMEAAASLSAAFNGQGYQR
jgi:acetyl esterase